MILIIVILLLGCIVINGFNGPKYARRPVKVQMMHEVALTAPMLHDTFHQLQHISVPHWAELAVQGVSTESGSPICPAFGEPGWGPLCFLNGNPVFNAFDAFQLNIQNSIVFLHDFLQAKGVKNAYGISIILFTCIIRGALFPITFRQLASAEKTKLLQPKIAEINEKYADDQNLKNQMVALLYQETEVNPLAGCLPALLQLPVFISLYRSFTNLAAQNLMSEPFAWLPDLEGPVYGTRSIDWLTQGWVDGVPHLGWETTAAYLTLPVLLVVAQSVSLNILTPPSDDPQVQQTQKWLKYLPLMIGYFSLSVPSALGIYWLTSNILSTVVSLGIKSYLKANPESSIDIDIEKLANNQFSAFTNPVWGYKSREQMWDEAKANVRPPSSPRIPRDFT
jgi:YidC/Oxa1 family membrane protein insertase